MTIVMTLLGVVGGDRPGGYLIATNLGSISETAQDPLLAALAPGAPERWDGIVIHHLGLPAGDAERVHRMHVEYGYQGLGYHFLVGNGNGLGDGIIHVGYRWNDQLAGAHVAQVVPDNQRFNARTVGICLVGNGNRRPFSDDQMRSLVVLVRNLQEVLGISGDQVHLHRDLASELTSPGEYFPAARFREQLLP